MGGIPVRDYVTRAARARRRPERNLVTPRGQRLHEERDDAFDPAVESGRDGQIRIRDDRDPKRGTQEIPRGMDGRMLW